ncbi:MAG: hypothetical protein ACOCQR_01105 [bacterium]
MSHYFNKKIICKDTKEVCYSYDEYLNSKHWKELKKRFKNSPFPKSCSICDEIENLHVHHRYYDRLGEENLSDLTYLCEECHNFIHWKLFRKKAPALYNRLFYEIRMNDQNDINEQII